METSTQAKPSVRDLARGALRIAFFRRTPESQVDASWMQIVGIVFVSLLPPMAYAAWSVGDEGHIDLRQLPSVLYHVPIMLIATAIAAALLGEGMKARPLLAAALLAWIPIDSIGLLTLGAMEQLADKNYLFDMACYFVPLVWLALAVARFANTLVPVGRLRKAAIVLGTVLFLGLPLSMYRERSLWTTDWSKKAAEYTKERESRTSAASEEVLYRQPELLRRQLENVQPQRKGLIDVYLIGIAGYGEQDVFMREVESVSRLFQERFDAEGRVISLVNNPKTALTYPFATATSLKASLERVAAVMDREEDVLVLFMTSHGSSDHKFDLTLYPLELKPLTPPMIREALDASGIKNRVVIVSACYAGGFVPSLKSDDTLVIAAAAPDRNSFGCSNENDWTYFGKAYFDEALRNTTSFTAAFEAAKPVIEQREKKEGYDPSMPQMSEGSAIHAKLAELERQLRERKPATR